MQIVDRPGRWLRECPAEVGFNYCATLSQGDWEEKPWIIQGQCTLIGVYLCADTTNGLISTIDTYPTMFLYNGNGQAVNTLIYSSILGYYVAQAEVCISTDYYVQVFNITVTLKNGDSCQGVDFFQYYGNNSTPGVTPAIELSTTQQVAFEFTIDGSDGHIDWGDNSAETYDASGSPQTPTHTYALSATHDVSIFGDATEIIDFDCNNKGLTGTIDIAQCTEMTDFDVSSNSALAQINNPFTPTVISTYTVDNTGLTSLNLSGLTGLGGAISINDCTSITSITFPTSSETITTFFFFDNTAYATSFDISGLTGFGGAINISGNTSMTSIVFPTSSVIITTLNCSNNDLTGTINASGLTGFGGTILFHTNTNMTVITLPTSSQTISSFHFYNTGLTSLDASTLTGLGGNLQVYNTDITSFTAPSSSVTFSIFHLYSNSSLTGTLVVSGLTGLGGAIALQSNDLSDITFPTSAITTTALNMFSNQLGYVDTTTMTFSSSVPIRMENNAMTAAEVNHMLVDWDANLPGAASGSLRIDGTNAAPDGTSGGYDGLTAKANLIITGYTVTTN